MASVAFMAPLLPNGAGRLRKLALSLAGPHLGNAGELHARMGVAAERWYLQATVRGDVVIVYLEGSDLRRALGVLAHSRAPFDVWFKTQARAIHGIDFNQPPLASLPTQLYHWSVKEEERE